LQVICGNRLPISLNCDPTIAEIMTQCWEGDPQRRPNFEYIHRRLKERHTQLMNEEREVRVFIFWLGGAIEAAVEGVCRWREGWTHLYLSFLQSLFPSIYSPLASARLAPTFSLPSTHPMSSCPCVPCA
jgi:hypothetical protein